MYIYSIGYKQNCLFRNANKTVAEQDYVPEFFRNRQQRKLKRNTADGNTRIKNYDLKGIETAKEFYEENHQPDCLSCSFPVD